MRDENPAPRRKKRRRLHWHVGFWMLVWLALGMLFLWLASLSLSGRVVALPDWVTDEVETRLNAQMENGSISLTRVEFGMSPRGNPRLQLVDLSVRDQTGLEIAQLHQLRGGLKPVALLQGQVQPSTLFLSGAQVTLRRRADGEFDLSFGQSGAASGDLASVLDTIDGVFTSGPLSLAESITADQLTITLEDARSGRLWQVTDGRLTLSQTEKIVDITVAFDVFNQTEQLAETVLGFRSAKGSSEASLGATFSNAAAADIAAQSPVLAFLGVLDAPISGALRTSIDADGRVADLTGMLQVGQGALSPAPGARPVRFDQAKVYLDYEPEFERVDFADISVSSEYGTARGNGHVYLRDFNRGLPNTFLGQINVAEALVNPENVFTDAVAIERGAADFRLRLDPFTLDIGQLVARHDGQDFHVAGQIAAGREGWSLSLDGHTGAISKSHAMTLWPVGLAPKPRIWVADNVLAGGATHAAVSVRVAPKTPRHVSVQAGFEQARVRVVGAMAPVENVKGYLTIEDQSLHIVAEQGQITAPNGATVDVGGTVFHVPYMPARPTPAQVDLSVNGPAGAVLSVLTAEPFDIFRNSSFGPDIATGHVAAKGVLHLEMKPKLEPKDVQFDVTADLSGLQSAVLVPGKVMTVDRAQLSATNDRVEITGTARIGAARARGSWFASLGPDADGRSRVEADLVLNQAFLDEFNIGLPRGTVSGEGTGRVEIDFAPGTAPTFSLVSDLNRLGLSVPDLSWSKARNRTGRLVAEGRLGDAPRIDRLEFEAPGLTASGGQVTVRPDGGLAEARFARVRMGGWLDAPVVFTGRGSRAAEISVTGGSVDMRRATFSGKPGGGSGDAPIRLALDRLTISEGIALTAFRGDLNRRGGLRGTFTARVNGGPSVRGVVAPQPNGSAVRIASGDAGGVLRAAGVFKTARGGDMTLILAPRAGNGVYDGQLEIANVRMVGASALAELLSAISVVGLLEQLGQEGISFSEVEARFRLTPTKATITSGSAVGASLGVSLDGTYTLGTGEMDMGGVISPIYLLNALGQVFTRKGEGLLGFTYTMKGTAGDPEISVNPLSIFTPGMFREIFRRPPPKLDE